jgi:3-phosphoshikimate 1-carboxyvinyltransferase
VPHSPELEIIPLSRPPAATIRVPGSKSITNRALVLAALYCRQSRCTLHGALRSEDTEVMVESLQRLGFDLRASWNDNAILVSPSPTDRIVPAASADLFVANSGTSMRFLTALVSLGAGRYRLDGVPRMRERPISDLLDALHQLGVRARSENGDCCPPVIVDADSLKGGLVRIKGDVSSQFLSALLLVGPLAQQSVTIEVEGPLVSLPYVTMTLEMMRAFGTKQVRCEGDRRFHIQGPPFPSLTHYHIEPDASAASYFFAAAAIASGEVTVPGISPQSLQGDVRFVDLLENMGCDVERNDEGITVRGGLLRGIEADMNDISDTVMTLAAVACFAEGPTTIRNVRHIRHKETDRLAALAAELRRVGAGVDERADGLTIHPAPLRAAVVETYNDHRLAMSLALLGLRVPGIVISNPACVGKTYPEFFTDFERLRQ